MKTPHPFFLSYSAGNYDAHLKEFYTYLNMRVKHLTGVQKDGFMASFSIEAGHQWKHDLVEALQGSPVLVPIYSPAYFRSEYCGNEMQVLLDRRREYTRKNGGKIPANIVPVYWHPCLKIPKTFPEFQYRLPSDLQKNTQGVWNLREDRRIKDFHAVAEDVALKIRDALEHFEYCPLQPLPDAPVITAINNAFESPQFPLLPFDSVDAVSGPDSVTFVYASVQPLDAWPYPPPQANMALRLASAIAKGKERRPHQLAFEPSEPNLTQRLRAAWQRNNLVILFVDAASLSMDTLRGRMVEYDQETAEFQTFSTMILWHENRNPSLEQVVRDTFKSLRNRQSPFFHGWIENVEQLENAVHVTLDKLRAEILKHPFRRDVEDGPGLPIVSGPGR
jgi:hypothetical protein